MRFAVGILYQDIRRLLASLVSDNSGIVWVRATPSQTAAVCNWLQDALGFCGERIPSVGSDWSPSSFRSATSRFILIPNYDYAHTACAEGDLLDVAASAVRKWKDGKVIVFSEMHAPPSRKVIGFVDLIPKMQKCHTVVQSSWVNGYLS